MVLAIGALRPARTKTSKTESNADESDDPAGMIGLISSALSPNALDAIRISCDRIQFILPFSVLISPLCANMRNGWARCHCGNVFVE